MPRYRRLFAPGATYFFTVTLADRRSDALVTNIQRLRAAFKWVQEREPFEILAICVLPDHLHTVWVLPPGDSNYPGRWNRIKSYFSRGLPPVLDRSPSKTGRREKGIWQRRYWEHQIRDETDLEKHLDYIHYNPVKHGLVSRVAEWPHSSFQRFVAKGLLPEDWGGSDEPADGKGE